MRQTITILCFLFLAALPLSVQATHIVGGEMTYKCLGNDQYEISLTIFRDCFYGSPAAQFDNPAAVGIFSNATNLLIDNVFIPLDPMIDDTLNPQLASDCLTIPPDVCVHTTTYTTTVTLPFIAGGYHLVYQRCCRNQTISNLIDPLDVGATYSIIVGEDALTECNSSPVFNDWPPLFLCGGLPFEIDQSATDEDGDSLVYRLCNPLTGANPAIPMPQPPNNPPYDTVPFAPGYGPDNFTNNPPVDVMSIDSETGLLTGTPNLLGQFVIGICVEEYRDGVLIGTNRRDYQVNVGDCEVITSAFFAPQTICNSLTVSLDNLSLNANDYIWYFNDPANPGANSTLFEPTYTYSDYGTYNITLIAEPGAVCADTATVQVTFVDNQLDALFDFAVLQCGDEILVQATDLSTDPEYDIVAWDWTLSTNGGVYSSTEQNPVFSVNETGPAIITLTVTSASDCPVTVSSDFLLKSNPLVLDLGPDLQSCSTENIILDAGPGFVTYEWNTTANTQFIVVNSGGTYSVTATDACGGTQIDEIEITIDTLNLDLPATVEICQGASYEFDVPGFASYEWSPADYLSCTDCPNPTTTPLMNITYTLTATSADGCVSTGMTEVILLPGLSSSLTLEACAGQTVTYNGTELSPGAVADFNFTASNGCDSVVTVTVEELPSFTSVVMLEVCEGETTTYNGTELGAGAMADFTFTASNGCDSVVTVAVIGLPNSFSTLSLEACTGETVVYDGTELPPGSVTDFIFASANGCDSTVTVTVNELPNVSTSESISICFGATTDIFGTETGTAGTYEMTFPAANGCDSTHTIILSVFDEISLSASSTSTSCFGGSDGTASANAGGGTGGFTYAWSTGGAGPSISGQPAGTYSVTATDSEGCTAETSVAIGQPTAVSVSASGVNVSCDVLGSASANAVGGTPGYTYIWSNGENGANISGLLAGTYTVTATDENGCTGSASVQITGALGPDVVVNLEQQLTEEEPMSGELSVDIIGGTAPFGIAWSNGETTALIDSLGSGEYTVTVTDANGCTATGAAYLFVPACTGGKLWNDTNRDGCQDGGELGIGGIEMELMGTDIWGNPVSAFATSAINGEYIFEGLPPGDYQVFLPIPDGYLLSPLDACDDDFTDSDFDENALSFVVDLAEGHCCLIVDGGLYDECLNVIDPGTICCDQTMCGPGNVPDLLTGTPATGAGGPIEYMWVYSHTNLSTSSGAWTAIPFSNSATYQPGALAQTTYFARCVRTIGCTDWLEGNIVEITVDDVAVAALDGPTGNCVGDEVEYVSTFDNGPGATYHWDFGPWASPSTATGETATITWNQAGIVYIGLTVVTDDCTSTAQLGVAISDNPIFCEGNLIGGNSTAVSVDQQPGFHTFPNPVKDGVNITWSKAIEGEVNLSLFSSDGRQLRTEQTDGHTMSHRMGIGTAPSGVYFLKIQTANGEKEMFRLMKE